MRLAEVEQTYRGQVDVRWRAFPLIADHRPGRVTTEQTRTGRARALAEEPRAGFVLPDVGIALPASSLPALTAAKAAERQGPDAFAALHLAIFAAHFRDHADIGRADVVWRIAQASGLDMPRFEADCAGGEPHRQVLRDYAEAVAWFGVSALPTVVFDEKVSLVGAVATEQYRAMIDWFLAGQPGGVIPLDAADAARAGQSAISARTS